MHKLVLQVVLENSCSSGEACAKFGIFKVSERKTFSLHNYIDKPEFKLGYTTICNGIQWCIKKGFLYLDH